MKQNIREILRDISQKILDRCPFFQTSFPYARQMAGLGVVLEFKNGEGTYAGPADINGNFFYIRISEKIQTAPAKSAADCGRAVLETYSCALVAIVTDADEILLKDAVLNSLLLSPRVIAIKAQSVDAPSIIEGELKGAKSERIAFAQARLSARAVVRVEFEIGRNFEANNCAYNTCQTCDDETLL